TSTVGVWYGVGYVAQLSAARMAQRRRNANVDHRRNGAERSRVERARREERQGRIEQTGPDEVRHHELLRERPADGLVIEGSGDVDLERCPPNRGASDVEEPQVKTCLFVGAALEHDGAADPAARGGVGDLGLHLWLVVPGTVEREH